MLTWLGIGAQRSGTTWFTELLTQHPECSLGRSNEKELHILDRAIEHRDVERVRAQYEREFRSVSGAIGEFTPSYLRTLWTAEVAAQVLDPRVVIVLLRDPIERFESAVRFNRGLAAKRRPKRSPGFLSSRAAEAQWASSYLPQLETWSDAVGEERMLVLQYERVVLDPQRAVDDAWRRMGLAAAPLSVPMRSDSGRVADERTKGHLFNVDRELGRLLLPQREGLEAWGIDFELWPRLRGSMT